MRNRIDLRITEKMSRLSFFKYSESNDYYIPINIITTTKTKTTNNE